MNTEPQAGPMDLPVMPGWKVWGGSRCAHCCNGDRCDDPTHYDRNSNPGCPHCHNTGYALWTDAGRAAKAVEDERVANYLRNDLRHNAGNKPPQVGLD